MLLINAILESLSTLKDKSVKIVFHSQELTVEQISELYKSIQDFVFLGIKGDVFKTQEKEILNNIDVDYADQKKTASQRLRAVLYVYFTQDNKGYSDFKDYYNFQMEKLINHFKDKLE